MSAPHPKRAETDHEVLDVIRDRWSPRAFDGSLAVSRADQLRLFEAARWAPSSANEQPWRFVVADRERTPQAHASLVLALTGRNPQWAASAPVLVLAALRPTFEHNDTANSLAWYDMGQAVAFLTLQATSMGLSVRQMEGFDHARVREAFSVPAPFEPVVVMAIGYAGDPSNLTHEKHRAAEMQPRTRRSLSTFVFEDTWGREFNARG
jgi:nitroreductase